MSWSEILYEELDKFQFCIYSHGEYVELNGFEDMELIVEIPKEKTMPINFYQMELFLKNIDPYDRVTKFQKFLKKRGIAYKTHIWQRPLT